jgi:hypothetical protein
VKSTRLTCVIDASGEDDRGHNRFLRDSAMKRSRRVVLTMMGTAAIGAVSTGFAEGRECGPGLTAIPGPDDRLYCRAIHGGFGGTLHHVHGHGHGGHAHGGHAHGGG